MSNQRDNDTVLSYLFCSPVHNRSFRDSEFLHDRLTTTLAAFEAHKASTAKIPNVSKPSLI